MVSGLVGVGGVERVWNAATGCEIAEHRVPDLTAFNRDFRSTFFPDGSRAATIDGSKLQVWDAANGKLLAEAKPCKCYCVNVSPDGRRLLTIGWSDGNHVAQLWDVSNLGGIAVLQPRYPDLCTGTFSPDGQRIILYNGASVWSAEDGTELWNLGSPLRGVTPASFDPQGRRIVSGDENGAIHIWTRRRPERWWGVACLPAFWVTMLVCGAFAWSFRRDRKTL
jgi:WD40 repeat protein